MKVLSRQIEVPRANTPRELKLRYPGWHVIGDMMGYAHPVEQTKTVIVALNFKQLVEAVKKHLEANDIPVPVTLEREMNEAACAEFPYQCEELDPDAERKISLWYQAKKFFTAVISAATQGLVSQEEAERRALICSTCPFNGGASLNLCSGGCHTAKFVKEAAEALSTKHTSLDNKLNTCGLCECSLKLKIWVPKEGMEDALIEWPAWCWMRD